MSVEDNLNLRIKELETALYDLRDMAEYNLAEPGNENDTLESVSSLVSSMLHDNYEFDLKKFLELEYE